MKVIIISLLQVPLKSFLKDCCLLSTRRVRQKKIIVPLDNRTHHTMNLEDCDSASRVISSKSASKVLKLNT